MAYEDIGIIVFCYIHHLPGKRSPKRSESRFELLQENASMLSSCLRVLVENMSREYSLLPARITQRDSTAAS